MLYRRMLALCHGCIVLHPAIIQPTATLAPIADNGRLPLVTACRKSRMPGKVHQRVAPSGQHRTLRMGTSVAPIHLNLHGSSERTRRTFWGADGTGGVVTGRRGHGCPLPARLPQTFMSGMVAVAKGAMTVQPRRAYKLRPSSVATRSWGPIEDFLADPSALMTAIPNPFRR